MKILISILCLLAAAAAVADPLDIPLTGLVGAYDTGAVPPDEGPLRRLFDFTIPPEVVSIDEMRLALAGSMRDGLVVIEHDVGGTVVRDTFPGAT